MREVIALQDMFAALSGHDLEGKLRRLWWLVDGMEVALQTQ